jgi:hypothetical protein
MVDTKVTTTITLQLQTKNLKHLPRPLAGDSAFHLRESQEKEGKTPL